ncbi:MAG: hypothetical protein QTN59_16340 [Candidatus Electrothrix communis]|nr:MAG: hypothetical protein QTN59_16340 [Candidatus Electrothrix communis]
MYNDAIVDMRFSNLDEYNKKISGQEKTLMIRKWIADFLVGFLGWFLTANIVFLCIIIVGLIGNLDIEDHAFLYTFGITTLIILHFLFFIEKDKFAYGIGIIAAVVTNAIGWWAIFNFHELWLSIIPLPLGFVIIFRI